MMLVLFSAEDEFRVKRANQRRPQESPKKRGFWSFLPVFALRGGSENFVAARWPGAGAPDFFKMLPRVVYFGSSGHPWDKAIRIRHEVHGRLGELRHSLL